MSICNSVFTLDEINIIGGDYKEVKIKINDSVKGGCLSPADLECNFSIVEYRNRNGSPILSKTLTADSSDSEAFLLTLLPDDTKNLRGKYIYQISVVATENKQESFQGVLIIEKNINPAAFDAVTE